MPYDEGLAQRIRELLDPGLPSTEMRMFGGLAFMVNGHMCFGILESSLMARIGPDAYPDALPQAHVRKMDFTGRPMAGYVFVDPPGIERDEDLARWLQACTSFVQSLPPKRGKRGARRT
jgi:hypothetical protein